MKNPTHESFERKANIKLGRILDLLYLLWGQGDVQCLQILAQMFDLAAANDGEDKRHPEKVICNRNYTITFRNSLMQIMRKISAHQR